MKRVVFILVLFIFSFNLYKPQIAQAASYTDPTMEDHAAALDVARGWADDVDENGKLICPTGQTRAESTNQKPNQEGMLSAAQNNYGWDLVGNLIGAGKTNCTDGRQLAFFNNSAIGATGKFIASMYANPPASGVYYAYDLLRNAGLVKPAYAQGIGFSGLTPILPIWKTFRNISYIMIVIMLVAVGFMIMFRMKINPQTVISIQTALPNIVVTLLAITFSYAIAGFLIDLMYFSIMLIITVFGQTGIFDASKVPGLQEGFLNAGMGTLFQYVVLRGDLLFALPKALIAIPLTTGAIGAGYLAYVLIGAINPLALLIGGLGLLLGALLPTLVLAIALFFVFIRIFFILLNSYIQIIITIIFAPFFLLMGAVPGNGAFGKWIKGLVGNLIVFPATITIFLLAGSISASVLNFEQQQRLWAPPFISGPTANSDVVVALIGFGFLMLAPALLNTLKQSIAGKPALPVGPGMIFQPVTALGSTGMQFMHWYHMFGGKQLVGKLREGIQTPTQRAESAKKKAADLAQEALSHNR